MGTGTHHFGSVRQRDQCAVSWLGPGSVCVCACVCVCECVPVRCESLKLRIHDARVTITDTMKQTAYQFANIMCHIAYPFCSQVITFRDYLLHIIGPDM